MRVNMTKTSKAEFITALKKAGGSSGNIRLRQTLDWDEKLYWKVQGELIRSGQIVAGAGKGGSVRFTEVQATKSRSELAPPAAILTASATKAKERDLYAPLKNSIEEKWIERFAFDSVIVAETHSRGAKDTEGTFTRPDITAVGSRAYVYLPKRLEIVTFEIKPSWALTIMGVLEAIAHREAAHRAYVMYVTSGATFAKGEGERITELALKYGVGVVLAETPDDVESWEIIVDAVRHEPDPARLDRFIIDLPDEAMKKAIAKWR